MSKPPNSTSVLVWGRHTKNRRWGLYRSDIPGYMERYVLALGPLGMFRLHHILRSDQDRHMHDHPAAFVSLILTGGYTEVEPIRDNLGGWVMASMVPLVLRTVKHYRPPGSIVQHRADDLHRLELEPGVTAWTVSWWGPFDRLWGFATEDGWVDFRTYFAGRSQPPEAA